MKRLFSNGRSRLFVIATAVAVLVAGGVTFAYGAARHQAVQPNSTVFYQATVGSEVIGGQNDGSGVGVEGIVGNTAGAIGMLGISTSTTHANIGMEGLARGPSSVGLYGQGLINADTTHPTVGLLGTSSSGFGVEGQSLIANTAGVDGLASDGLTLGQLGVGGSWGVHGTLTGTGIFESAVDGEATAAGTFSTGTFGLSAFLGGTAPSIGVLGGGSSEGVLGGADSLGDTSGHASVGVLAEDVGNNAFPDFNDGLAAQSTFGIAVLAEAGGQSQSFRPSSFSTALWVDGGNVSTSSTYAVGEELEAGDSNTDLLYAYDDVDGRVVKMVAADSNLLEGFGSSGSFSFDTAGNERLSGLITTSGFCSGGCSRTLGGRHELTYAAQSSEPTLEDYGEGQLVAGSANVRLEASFANAIDGRHGFLVFLTPEGDNRGLYVTNRTANSFTVREAQGGRSTLNFMYRVVAKPYGVTAARLPMVDSPSRPVQPGSHGLRAPRFLDPYQALVASVGKTRADQLVRQYLDKIKQQQNMQNLSPHADGQGRLHLGSTIVRAPNPH